MPRRKNRNMSIRQFNELLRSMRPPEPSPERIDRIVKNVMQEIEAEMISDEFALTPRSRTSRPLRQLRPTELSLALISLVLVAGLIVLSGTGRAFLIATLESTRLYTVSPDSDPDRISVSWRQTSDMPDPRAEHVMAVLTDGSVLAVGGRSTRSGEDILRSTALLDPAGRTWIEVGGLLATRMRFGNIVPLPDGSALLAGGSDRSGNHILDSTERYVPGQRAWVVSGSLSTPRADAPLVALADGRILISGGIGEDSRFLATAEIYDPVTKEWLPTGSMPLPRADHELVRLLDGRVLALGGSSPSASAVSDVALFDARSGEWESAGRLINGRLQSASIVLPTGEVLVSGGHNGQEGVGRVVYSATELYDPSAGTSVATMQPMTAPRAGHSLHLLSDGRVLALGGEEPLSGHATTDLFDSRTQIWTTGPATTLVSSGFAAASLEDGGILVTGGWDASGAPRSTSALLR